MPEEQSYASHTRWHPLHHFIVTPLLLIHFGYTITRLSQETTLDRADDVLLAALLILISILTRINALRVQDRVIRLEEQRRFAKLLAPAIVERASALRPGLIVALRFASDSELPVLVQQVLDGKLTTSKKIKQAVRTWRADNFRV